MKKTLHILAFVLCAVTLTGATSNGVGLILPMFRFKTVGSSVRTTAASAFFEGDDMVQTSFHTDVAGYYAVVFPARMWSGSETYAPFVPFLDDVPMDHGTDRVSGSDYVFFATDDLTNFRVEGIYLYPGEHDLQIQALIQTGRFGKLEIQSPSVILTSTAAPPREPEGARDPIVQPFRSYNIWNTAIGSGALWSNPNDADTETLTGLTAALNSSSFSWPIYVASANDPLIRLAARWRRLPARFGEAKTPWSRSFVPSPDSDHNIGVYDPTRRTIEEGFNCTITASPYETNCTVSTSVCAGANGAGHGVNGLMRVSEIESGHYSHMLLYAVSQDVSRPGPYIWSVAWPQYIVDECAPECYSGGSGGIMIGSTVGIPSTVKLDALALSPDGLAVATALQNYGAMTRATGGSRQFILYAEQAADDSGCCTQQMMNIRQDLPKIMPYLRILRNQTAGSVNGGGERLAPPIARISQSICP